MISVVAKPAMKMLETTCIMHFNQVVSSMVRKLKKQLSKEHRIDSASKQVPMPA